MARLLLPTIFALLLIAKSAFAADAPSREVVQQAMKKAATFFHEQVSIQGGYLWKYSSDLKLHQGEAVTDDTRVWVQPPGTPAVGLAMLKAYQATGDGYYLDAAQATAECLIRGQMQSGGWDYYVELDPEKRKAFAYRDSEAGRKARNYTTLDDNVTQAATRFLVELDGVLMQSDAEVHDAADYALRSILAAQYPNGGWYVWWKEFPDERSAEQFPVKKASYPAEWNRTWKAQYPGIYVTNDNLVSDMIDLLLTAHRVYGEQRYLDACRRAGDFLLLAQMPEPQPAWAQQYDVDMHPVWARKFEPPAISGGETQQIIGSLMQLYRATGEEKYLRPIPPALAWLRRSQIEPGKVARFYELQTNRPLYFERRGDLYTLTHELGPRLPDHYGFVLDLRADRLEAEYRQTLEEGPRREAIDRPSGVSRDFAGRVQQLIDQLDSRGAWTEAGWVRNVQAKKVEPAGGIIESATFVKNLGVLSEYVRRARP
jgi:hypothetical protein